MGKFRLFSILLFLHLGFFSHNSHGKEFGFSQWDLENLWDTSRISSPDNLVTFFDPQLGSHALQIIWTTDDYAKGYRSEIADQELAPNDQAIYYSFWFKIPSNFNLRPQDSCVLMQFHTPDSSHKPQLAFRARGNGRLDVTLNHETANSAEEAKALQKKPVKLSHFPGGVWHFVEMEILWSHRNGFIDIWINSQPILKYRGQTNFKSQPTGPYFKMGVYPAINLPYSLSAEFGPYSRFVIPIANKLIE